MDPRFRVAVLNRDRRVRKLQGFFVALLIEPQLREVRERLAVAWTQVQCPKIPGRGLFQSAEVVQRQTGAVGRLAVIRALFRGDAVGVERLLQPVSDSTTRCRG